jgi:23S rRNA (guanosine2251-2'-O)-methyltransferase
LQAILSLNNSVTIVLVLAFTFALMRKLSMDELGRKSVEEFKKADKNKVIVVLDNIRSMHNVGSVFRTADAFLIEAIFLCGYTPQPPHRDINKTALGATETVDWIYYTTTKEAVDDLKSRNYEVYGIEQTEGSISLENFAANDDEKLAVVFGNEVEGVDADVLKLCDGSIEIPQLGMKHSLNISVAAGIVLWKMCEPRFIRLKG